MKKFKYLKLSKTKKLRYIDNYFKKKLYLIFLPGFMSDIEGKKPQTFLKYAIKKKIGFLSFEYSGHGKSSGVFTKGNISTWSEDAKKVIKKIIKIKGFIGVGSAPEFLTKLMWNKFSKKTKQELLKKGKILVKNGGYEYPITLQLIKDGKKNKVLNKRINSKINVTMIHGQKDEVVPTFFSKQVLKLFNKAKKKIVIIKNGDHSLSNQKQLKRIIRELDTVVKDIS